MDSDTLRTPRLLLEPIEERHAAVLFDGLRDATLYRYLDERPPERVEDLADRYRTLSRRVSPDGGEAWLNWALRASSLERHVGYVQATVRPDRSAHVAYVLFHDAWGQGFAREAVAALIEHLRVAHRVRLLRASVDPRNRRSIALLEALGFLLPEPGSSEEAAAPRSADLEYHRSLD